MSLPLGNHVAVVGGGLMGCGIAFVFAFGGYDVIICDPDASRREEIPDRIQKICQLLEIPSRDLASIETAADLPAAAGAGIVVEAAPENLELKQEIFEELDRCCSPQTVLATNTSALPISRVAERVKSKDRVVGTHFWNPPHLIELVEVVLGPQTSEDIGNQTADLLTKVGMTPVIVKKDVPGFIGNRLQHALKREAISLVANGICDARTVDTVVKLGFGARLSVMGPLEQSDLLGLELTQAVHQTLMPDLDVTTEPHPYLQGLIKSGKVGAKVGEGFCAWTPSQADAARERLSGFLVAAAKRRYEKISHTPNA